MKIKGQQLVEVAFIGAVILLTGLLSLFLFSGNIKAIFDSRNPASFLANRNTNQINTYQYLSKVNLQVNGQSLKSPVETVIKQEMQNNVNQTSGSSGLTETAEVMQQYITQLESILNTLPSSNPSVQALITSLNNYDNTVNDYMSKNNAIVTGVKDPLVKMENDLQLSINIDSNGAMATSLNNALVSIEKNLSGSKTKKLVQVYTNDMLNLGKSLNFSVDSRLSANLGLPVTVNTSTLLN